MLETGVGMATVKLSSPDCWLDCLATLPDCDVSDLCKEVLLVGSEGDTTTASPSAGPVSRRPTSLACGAGKPLWRW